MRPCAAATRISSTPAEHAGARPSRRALQQPPYFPMQKRPKISPSRSSLLNWPVISPNASVRQPQFLGQQLQHRVARRRVRLRGVQVVQRAPQRLHVPRAGDEQALGHGLPACLPQQALAQACPGPARCGPRSADPVPRARHRPQRRALRPRAGRPCCRPAAPARPPAAGRRSPHRPPRWRARPIGTGRAGTAPRRLRRWPPSCGRCRCVRPRRRHRCAVRRCRSRATARPRSGSSR